MAGQENLGSFFQENKKLVKEYIETRLTIYKLQFTKTFSQAAGSFIWIIISLFLLWLLIIFLGLVTGFWLSGLTGSYTAGFGITSLIILVVVVVLALLRKPLFIDPIIRRVIRKIHEDTNEEPGE